MIKRLIKFLKKKDKNLSSLYQLDNKIFSAIFYFKRMYDKISNIEGDIVECGIGYSRTFQILSLLLKNERKQRILWGFDSFEGFPDPTKEDDSLRNPKKGEWKVIELEDVYTILERIRLDKDFIDNQIKIVKGFFDETLIKTNINKIALLHLDVDLYNSYKICLEQLFPKVVKGGVVMFDEYESPNFPGAKKQLMNILKIKM